MDTKTYNIVITGELLDGVTREQAIESLAKAFKIPQQKAEAIFTDAPRVIKAGLDRDKAKGYLTTLKKLNIDCRAETNEAEAVAQNRASQAMAAKPATQQSVASKDSETTHSAHSASYEPKNPKGMIFRIDGKPDYGFLTVKIPAGEILKVEASAMATMDTHIKMKTKVKGGFGRFLTGEKVFINEFKAENIPGEIGIAPGTPGDLSHLFLERNTVFLQNSAYVASTSRVTIETKWQGLTKGFFSGESLFLIRCSGTGDLWFNTYGAIIEIDVKSAYVVDTGNIVAFTEGLEYKIAKVGGYKSLFFSGEGFVCRFSGTGKVWIQTRSASAFTHWANFYRPVKNSK
ncbi:MAG: TIGR00266 family protein [Reinekea sp.]